MLYSKEEETKGRENKEQPDAQHEPVIKVPLLQEDFAQPAIRGF
jgi:hypothetical protein